MTDETVAPGAGGETTAPALSEGDVWGARRGLVDRVRDAFGRFTGGGKGENEAPAAAPAAEAPEAAPVKPADPVPVPAPVAQAAPPPAPVPETKPLPPAPPPPSLTQDPEAYQRYQEQMRTADRLEMSVMVLKTIPGYEDYDAAEAAFMAAAAENPVLAQRAISAPNPALFAYREGKKLQALKEWGDDPGQFLTKAEEKLFADPAALVEKLAANPAIAAALAAKFGGAAPTAPAQAAAPSNVTSFPPSLATARSTGGRAGQPYTPPSEGDVWGARRTS